MGGDSSYNMTGNLIILLKLPINYTWTSTNIIYNHNINNILVINLKTLNSLLANNSYQEFYENNTLILISNYEDYGKEINNDLKQLIIFCFKSLINQLIPLYKYKNLEKYSYYTKEEYEYFKKNEQKIIDFNESFTNYYV